MSEINTQAVVEQVVAEQGFKLYSIEQVSEHGEAIFRVNLFLEDRSIGLDDCVQVQKALYPLLEEPPLLQSHTLQVSSVGIEKPLLVWWHYEAALGEQVSLKLHHMLDVQTGAKKITGKLKSLNEQSVQIEFDGESFDIGFDNIKSAKTVFEF